MMRILNIRLFLALTLLFSVFPMACGYAAWLKCYVDLMDDTEIIMNNLITPESGARHTVTIEVKPADEDYWRTTLSYRPNISTLVTARLQVPPEISHMDVQYVMEVVSGGASFVRPKMCEGRRGHATHYGEAVLLDIDGSTESFELHSSYAIGH